MFEEQGPPSLDSGCRADGCLDSAGSISLNVQYQICSNFMKKAGEQIYLRELQMMQATSQTLQKVQEAFMQKDIASTQESMTSETFFDQDQSFSQPSRSGLLLRKSRSSTSIRRTDSGLNEALWEVQRNCSERTSSMLSNLAAEYRRTKQKLASSEKYQRELRRLEGRYTIIEQDFIISRKRVSDLEKDNQIQGKELQSLKAKAKEAAHSAKERSLTLSRSSEHLIPLSANTPSDKIRSFLSQKQLHIYKKQKEIRVIQDRIQTSLDSSLPEGCSKCCLMMKRMKEGIMKYRVFLEEEANAAELSYNTLKAQFS